MLKSIEGLTINVVDFATVKKPVKKKMKAIRKLLRKRYERDLREK